MSDPKKKRPMPRGMYVGSAWIGFAIVAVLCWVLAFRQSASYVEQGVGDVANFMTILICLPIFGFALPMLIGIRTIRRAGRERAGEEEGEP